MASVEDWKTTRDAVILWIAKTCTPEKSEKCYFNQKYLSEFSRKIEEDNVIAELFRIKILSKIDKKTDVNYIPKEFLEEIVKNEELIFYFFDLEITKIHLDRFPKEYIEKLEIFVEYKLNLLPTHPSVVKDQINFDILENTMELDNLDDQENTASHNTENVPATDRYVSVKDNQKEFDDLEPDSKV